jgi:hypothetical protein
MAFIDVAEFTGECSDHAGRLQDLRGKLEGGSKRG